MPTLLVVDLLAEREAFGEHGTPKLYGISPDLKFYFGLLIPTSPESILSEKE